MTTTRLCTLTAERQTVNDLSLFVVSSAPTISSTKARTGTYSYRHSSTGTAFGRAIGAQSAVRIGYWVNHAGLLSGGTPNLFVLGNGVDRDESTIIRAEWDGDSGTLAIKRATALDTYEDLASESVPASLLATDTWIHIGLTYFSHETLGFMSVYINGVKVLSVTGDTRPSAWNGVSGGGSAQIFGTTISRFWVFGRVTTDSQFANFPYVDDIYVDTYDSETDAPVPTKRFIERIANGAGEDAEWTPLASTNVSQIDDGQPSGGANDGDTTYNKAESSGLRDTFTFDDIAVPSGYRVVAVIPYAHCKTLDAGPTIKMHLWDGANYADSDELTPPLDYTIEVSSRFTAMPDASAFSEAGVNGLEVGYASAGAFS